MGRNLRKMAEDEFENLGSASTLGDLRVVDDVIDEDRCRTRKDASPLNFAIIGHTGYSILQADNTRASLRRKRACIDPKLRTNLAAA